jgi:hypothetical protein
LALNMANPSPYYFNIVDSQIEGKQCAVIHHNPLIFAPDTIFVIINIIGTSDYNKIS